MLRLRVPAGIFAVIRLEGFRVVLRRRVPAGILAVFRKEGIRAVLRLEGIRTVLRPVTRFTGLTPPGCCRRVPAGI